jgi:hypothetical protein
VKDKVEQMQEISIINGRGDNLPSLMQASDFHQMVYNRIKQAELDIKKKQDRKSFRDVIGNAGWWADNIIRIVTLVGLLLLYLGYNHLSETLSKIPH